MDKDIDDSISVNEIKDIYENFHWAMFPDYTAEAMAEYVIETYGDKEKKTLTFD